MRLSIDHRTVTEYRPEVEEAWHLAYLQPADDAASGALRLLKHNLHIWPPPEQQHTQTDTFGNQGTWFCLQQPHASLEVRATSEVYTAPAGALPTPHPWESARDAQRYQKATDFSPALEFLHGSPMAPIHEAFAQYAAPSFTANRSLSLCAIDLCQRIHREFRYDPASTDVNTPAIDALKARHGVCQDFAHVLIACLRSMGFAARYVSGYLLTHPAPGQPRLIGADASHAWASLHLPAHPNLDASTSTPGAWLDLDPTNNRFGVNTPGEDYVRLALGRDYGDVPPLRGVIHGAQRQSQSVEVTVLPVDVSHGRSLPAAGG